MTALVAEIQRAKDRLDFDPAACVHRLADKLPREIAPPQARRERLEFLQRSLGSDLGGLQVFERVLLGNEIQPASYLARGAIALQSIARINVRDASGSTTMWGTGFLIAPNVLLTNNHVIESAAAAALSQAQFGYEIDLADAPLEPVSFALDPERLFLTAVELDFTVVAVKDISVSGQVPLRTYGYLPLLDVPGKALEGEWLTIAQHPRGERKQLCVRENRLIKRADDVLWYSTDTLPGSSGAPVFNNDWFVVALHHSGVAEEKNGKVQTIDGRDYDEDTMDPQSIKWIANEGIRASRIAQTLKQARPGHQLLQPMFDATPASARIRAPISLKETAPMSSQRLINVPVTLSFELRADGSLVPAGVSATLGGAVELGGEAAAKKKKPPPINVPFNDDYSQRKGFQQDFLGDGALRVLLPEMSQALTAEATLLLKPGGGNNCILHYHNFSNVMHAKRRFAIYSAANVSFAHRYDMSRPEDVWRRDPRIPRDAQVENWYYSNNNFDRGHLTRREDLEYGPTPEDALASAADTCHWVNCTPQHAQFNQNKEIWQGIERHLLEDAIIKNHFNAQVFTGPIFDEGDPEYRKVQYPQQYWKVVAALNADGKLFATAYVLSQVDIIDRYRIEAEVPFGPYKTYQVKISEVERLTDLKFFSGSANNKVSLQKFDPLETPARPGRRRRVRRAESMVLGAASDYLEIADLDDIQT
jgi:endonuclease G